MIGCALRVIALINEINCSLFKGEISHNPIPLGVLKRLVALVWVTDFMFVCVVVRLWRYCKDCSEGIIVSSQGKLPFYEYKLGSTKPTKWTV